jgi:hypothetical protein
MASRKQRLVLVMYVQVGDTYGSGYPLVYGEEETSEVGSVEVEWWPQGRPDLSPVSPLKNFSPLPGRSCSGGGGVW